MKPLGFALPPLVQIAWGSPLLRERWEASYAEAPLVLARRWISAIGRGALPAAIVPAKPYILPTLMRDALSAGIEARPLADKHSLLGRMGWRAPALTLTVAIGSRKAVETMVAKLEAGDEASLLEEAGWPSCCAAARAASSMASPLWSFILAAEGAGEGGPAWHPLLRALGICLLPHVPCAPTCAASACLADRLSGNEAADVILSWPTRWSALHGLVEILSPVAKIVHDIDPTAGKHEVGLAGGSLPDDTPFGLVTPYRKPRRRRLRATTAFQRGIATPLENGLPPVPELARIRPPFPDPLPPVPTVLEGVADGWPAMDKWTLPYLRERFGARQVRVNKAGVVRQMALRDYVDALADGTAGRWYLIDFGFEREAPEMLQDFVLPSCLDSWHHALPDEERPSLLSLYIGGAGSGAGIHFDLLYTCGFNTLLSGRKVWYFCPPSTPAERLERQPNLFDPATRDLLRLQGLRLRRHVQQPGETLFIPSGWWHQTRNDVTSIALTGNLVTSANAEKVRAAALSADHPVLREIGALLIRAIEASRGPS